MSYIDTISIIQGLSISTASSGQFFMEAKFSQIQSLKIMIHQKGRLKKMIKIKQRLLGQILNK